MSSNNYNIEKFKGEFQKEEMGVSILINETVNSIKNTDVLGLYCYLACRPHGWSINAKHLLSHFKCSKDKIYKMLNRLIELNLLTVADHREKGMFKSKVYKLWVRPLSPCPEKPDTVKPDTEKPDTYKEKNIKNKERKKTTTVFEEKKAISFCNDPTSSCFNFFLSEKEKQEYLKFKIKGDTRNDKIYLDHIIHHIENNSDKKYSLSVRKKAIKKILKELFNSNALFISAGYVDMESLKREKEKRDFERQQRELIAERKRLKELDDYYNKNFSNDVVGKVPGKSIKDMLKLVMDD